MRRNRVLYLVIIILLLLSLFYTRLINLSWGLPYPFHPDERNMANAVQNLECGILKSGLEVKNCFNPQFFAYGQFPLYTSYLIVQAQHFFLNTFGSAVSFVEATQSLRLLSVFSSVLVFATALILAREVYKKDSGRNKIILLIIISLLTIFSPGLIQFAHFGTTESILMFCYLALTLYALRVLRRPYKFRDILFSSIIAGIAVATKVSSIILILPTVLSFIYRSVNKIKRKTFLRVLLHLTIFLLFSTLFSIIFSPHNLISFGDFMSSIRYESDVALGKYVVFYSRQFVDSIPLIFQFTRIFPYTLGLPVFVLGLLGFVMLPKTKELNMIRFALFIYLLPATFIFAKWTRFMAPIIPLFVLLAGFTIYDLYKHLQPRIIFSLTLISIVVFASVIPGVAYLSIYRTKDVRIVASEWINAHLPAESVVLSETANVIDIPISDVGNQGKKFRVISFNFYDLDINEELEHQLNESLSEADFILIPSRRIFANHTCQMKSGDNLGYYKSRCKNLAKDYPKLKQYYEDIFLGNFPMRKVHEFTSYPKIELLGKTILEFPDEKAEEGWTVFDHPVIRLYKRIGN